MSKNRIQRALLAAAVVAGLGAMGAPTARAVPIVGEYTLVDVTSIKALNAAGVTLSGLGSAEIFATSPALGVLLAIFPVTGGEVDLPNSFAGTIDHAGSGLRVTFLGTNLDLTNFTIDTVANKLSADFTADIGSGRIDLFDISECDAGPPGTCATIPTGAVIPQAWRLAFTQDAAAVLNAVFGLPSLAGVQFGVANTAILPIPEPGTALLLGSALLGLGLARRRSQ